jgi:hypothetical protein
MHDRYDEPVAVSRSGRIFMGVVLILGGSILLVGALMADRSGAENRSQLILSLLWLGALGLAAWFLGVRLIMMKDGERLLSTATSAILGVIAIFLASTLAFAAVDSPSAGELVVLATLLVVGVRLCLPWVRERR